jgi:precorrin-6A/cobalt-precorrin-6A reductase
MIVLLGGTSESAFLAAALVSAGHSVLVSTATDAPLKLPDHPLISRRCGRLDAVGLIALLRDLRVKALVDATHPYATEAQTNAREAARAASIPYFRWQRAESVLGNTDRVVVVANHDEAARLAFSYGCTVLLTIGSRNLAPYAREAARTGIGMAARVLPLPESLEACHRAGLPEAAILAARGPFSIEENRSAIRRTGAGVLVMKDGGFEGGVPSRMEAARLEGCRVVLVRRPPSAPTNGVRSLRELFVGLERWLGTE